MTQYDTLAYARALGETHAWLDAVEAVRCGRWRSERLVSLGADAEQRDHDVRIDPYANVMIAGLPGCGGSVALNSLGVQLLAADVDVTVISPKYSHEHANLVQAGAMCPRDESDFTPILEMKPGTAQAPVALLIDEASIVFSALRENEPCYAEYLTHLAALMDDPYTAVVMRIQSPRLIPSVHGIHHKFGSRVLLGTATAWTRRSHLMSNSELAVLDIMDDRDFDRLQTTVLDLLSAPPAYAGKTPFFGIVRTEWDDVRRSFIPTPPPASSASRTRRVEASDWDTIMATQPGAADQPVILVVPNQMVLHDGPADTQTLVERLTHFMRLARSEHTSIIIKD